MGHQWATSVRDAVVAVVESTIGTAPTLEIRTGAKPANCAAADSGTLIASQALPSDWLSAPSSGVGSKAGTWQLTASIGGGGSLVPGHYRIKAGGSCVGQGDIYVAPSAIPADGGMQVSTSPIYDAQVFTVTTATVTAGGA